jgi:hypothetical protein
VNSVQDISKPNYVVREDNDVHYHSTPTTSPPHHPFHSSPIFLPCLAGVRTVGKINRITNDNKRPQGLQNADVEPIVTSSPLQATFCSVVNFSGHVCYKQKNTVATVVNLTVTVFKILRTNNTLAWKFKVHLCNVLRRKIGSKDSNCI